LNVGETRRIRGQANRLGVRAICRGLAVGVNSSCSSDRGGLRGRQPHGYLGDPKSSEMRVQAETPGPPARDPAEMLEFAPDVREGGWVGKER